MKTLDFSLATTEEIMRELSRRAKQKRKGDMGYYGDQKKFARHIGVTHRRYQQFEMSGKITLEKFIDVLRGLHALDEIQNLLELGDEALFREKRSKQTRKTASSDNNKDIKEVDRKYGVVKIPDVFNVD